MQAMKSIKAYYTKRGFNIVELRTYQKFELDQAALADMEIELNASVRNDHVPDIERLNRTTKEQVQYVYTELILVYDRIPRVLVHEIIYAVMFWLNSFPAEDGISATLIPRAMITVQSVKFTKHCLLEFGSYVHTHEDREKYMEYRTIKALALRPTGNSQGGHYFINLHTGTIINRFTWTALLLPTYICKLARRIALRSPIALEFLDGIQHEVPDAEPEDDETDK